MRPESGGFHECGYGVLVSRTDELNVEQVKKQVPGGEADKPTEIPPKGWFQVVRRGFGEAKVDQVPLLAAGVAFYAFLAIFPALIAVVLIYGLVVEPRQIAEQIGSSPPACPRRPAGSSPIRSLWRLPGRLVQASGRYWRFCSRCGLPQGA